MRVSADVPKPRVLAAPDPDVQRAATGYRPNWRGTPAGDGARLTSIASDAIRDLEPFVLINRRTDSAAYAMSRDTAAAMPTIHDDRSGNLVYRTLRHLRGINERRIGVHGTGANGGHTAFGSVGFVPNVDAKLGTDAVLRSFAERGQTGLVGYGPVSFLAPARALTDRITFAGDDSGVTRSRPAPIDRLPDVIAERLANPNTPGDVAARLLSLPHQAAVDSLRGWLLHTAPGDQHSFLEAQIRGMRLSDVIGGLVHLGTARPMTRYKLGNPDPGHDVSPEDLVRLRSDFTRHGLPLVEAVSNESRN